MRREFVEHRGLHLVDALQRDLPALGSRRQVHRAGCQSIPRDVEERAVFGHCVECLERTTRRNPRDKSQAHNGRDRQRQGCRPLPLSHPMSAESPQAPPSATERHRALPTPEDRCPCLTTAKHGSDLALRHQSWAAKAVLRQRSGGRGPHYLVSLLASCRPHRIEPMS